jgi:hypothetical protein
MGGIIPEDDFTGNNVTTSEVNSATAVAEFER